MYSNLVLSRLHVQIDGLTIDYIRKTLNVEDITAVHIKCASCSSDVMQAARRYRFLQKGKMACVDIFLNEIYYIIYYCKCK